MKISRQRNAARKEKVFRDAVHGYISVPDKYCSDFVDTDVFQRLRQIEQTSMRVLYPCAHHDRFAHSMGVFHLGSKAFHFLRKNSSKGLAGVTDKDWERLKQTFQIACLLHDCGHAPFSHTFEKYYDLRSRLDPELKRHMNSATFDSDYKNCSPSPHEKASAILVLTCYEPAIRRHGGDPKLAARMIIGCLHRGPKRQPLMRLENCLVQLLNGKAFDVDKLDYTARDTWASGVNNSTIDIQRALAALCVRPHLGNRLTLAFDKSALSVIQNLLDGRNFLFQWIYAHHKVRYDQYLLERAIEGVARQINPEESESVLLTVFNVKTFTQPATTGNFSVHQPADGDLIHMMKAYQTKVPEAQEWLSRNHKRKALWKTEAEYHVLFGQLSPEQRQIIQRRAQEYLTKFEQRRRLRQPFVILSEPPKIVTVAPNEIYVTIDDKVISYTETGLHHQAHNRLQECFFVYAPLDALKYKSEIIRGLKNLA